MELDFEAKPRTGISFFGADFVLDKEFATAGKHIGQNSTNSPTVTFSLSESSLFESFAKVGVAKIKDNRTIRICFIKVHTENNR